MKTLPPSNPCLGALSFEFRPCTARFIAWDPDLRHDVRYLGRIWEILLSVSVGIPSACSERDCVLLFHELFTRYCSTCVRMSRGDAAQEAWQFHGTLLNHLSSANKAVESRRFHFLEFGDPGKSRKFGHSKATKGVYAFVQGLCGRWCNSAIIYRPKEPHKAE